MGGLGSGNGGAARRVLHTSDVQHLGKSMLAHAARPGVRGKLVPRRGTELEFSCPEVGYLLIGAQLPSSVGAQLIETQTTECRGATSGERRWWVCPRCSRRCGDLYWLRARFACRVCQGLRYHSQSLGELDRAYLKESKIATKIKPEARPTDFPRRPKGMQRRTFEKLLRAWCAADWKRDEVIAKELAGIARRYYGV